MVKRRKNTFEYEGLKYIIISANKVMIASKNTVCGDVVIPSKVYFGRKKYIVSEIGYDAFSCQNELLSISFPNTITYIGFAAFAQCTRLTSIVIPPSVNWIGEYAFVGCTKLTSVTLENRKTSLHGDAFWACPVYDKLTKQ